MDDPFISLHVQSAQWFKKFPGKKMAKIFFGALETLSNYTIMIMQL